MQVMEPLRSRCLSVRVAAPRDDQVLQLLAHVAGHEGLLLPPAFAARVASAASRNLRRCDGTTGAMHALSTCATQRLKTPSHPLHFFRALLSLEVAKVQAYPFTDSQPVSPADWECYVAEVAGVGHGGCFQAHALRVAMLRVMTKVWALMFVLLDRT